MTYEWFVARRYLWSRRRHPFVGVISAISALGIAVGTAALVVVLSVMSGFDHDLKERIIGLRAHLVVEREGGLEAADELAARLERSSAVSGASPYVEGQALLQRGAWGTGVLVRGIDPAGERKVSRFDRYLTEGSLADGPGGVVLGGELAKRLGVRIGDEVQLLSQQSERPKSLKVEGLFSSGMYEYDANLAYVNLPQARELFGLGPSAASGVSVSLPDADRAPAVQQQLQQKLSYPYQVRTWMDLNRTLFGALQLEKIVMFVILALIVFVACLNIAGCLTILVIDKTRDIGVLKALGAAPGSLVRIFAIDGLLLGIGGSAAGVASGLGLCALLSRTRLIELPKEIYYTDRLPVRVEAADVASVFAVAVLLALGCAMYPALTAGRLDPVKALRHE